MLARYRKTVASFIGGIITWASVAYVPDGHVDRIEWYALVLVLAGVAGVFAVPNDPPSVPVVPIVPVVLEPVLPPLPET